MRCEGFVPVTASALIFPERTCPTPCGTGPKNMETSPPSSAVIAGAAPLYGTWVISTQVSVLKSSPQKGAGEPMPAEEKVSLPGSAFAFAINSATVEAPTEGCTNKALSERVRPAMGAKSPRGSGGEGTSDSKINPPVSQFLRANERTAGVQSGPCLRICVLMSIADASSLEDGGDFARETGVPEHVVASVCHLRLSAHFHLIISSC